MYMEEYQKNYAAQRPQMYNEKQRLVKAKRMVVLLREHYGTRKLNSLTLLDIGSSTGIISNYLSKYFKKVVAVDIDKKAIEYAKQKFKTKNLQFVYGDAMNLPFKKNIFDVVVCAHVYEHVPDDRILFSEIHRVLKLNGVCYLAAINSLWPVEPHYNLPFLSWLPKKIANSYLRITKRIKFYYEKPRSYFGLCKVTSMFDKIEYTQKILKDPRKFRYSNKIKGLLIPASKLFSPLSKYLAPTFFWLLIKKNEKKCDEKGTFCISLDTEFLWSRKYAIKKFTPRVKKERRIILKLLKIFKRYKIPATWAIVGKLFYKPTKHKRESYLWKGLDIVEKIQSTPRQEIGCHSFSHKVFTEISVKEAESEVKQCINLAQKNNIKLNSFVFPKNEIAHVDILKKNNFVCYRGKSKNQSKISQLVNVLIPLGNSSQITIKNGMINIPATMYYPSSRGIKKIIPNKLIVFKIKLGINKAIRKGELFHLWFHPTDLTENTDKLLMGLEKVLLFADKKRTEKLLEIKTMEEIASNFTQD